MAHRNIITLSAAVLVALMVSGCLDSSREQSTQLRWQRTMDQARLQAAQQGLQEGRLVYAQRILKECDQCSDPKSPLAEQMEQILAKIQSEHNHYAKAGQEIAGIEDMTY
ncbi:MAG: hypothetical protein ISS71_00425 [Phycisphaerae bacterium]|nr:hypothetical protein [Phycisphaerae bacterium]